MSSIKNISGEKNKEHIEVTVRNISKRFGVVNALTNISAEFGKGKLTTLLGPSGCGKTTLLRIIAGFENPDNGDVFIEDRNVIETPPNKRGVSIIFQNYALFPHMSVFENIAYGLRVKKFNENEIKDRVNRVAKWVQLTETELKRYPNQLSGGQQQRVAVAMAIVTEPKVLLLDEPLSNLDAKIKEYLRDEIRRLQLRVGITAIYVTHDQAEATAISDEIIILNKGHIEQKGTPEDLYFRPINKWVADFMGKANFLRAEIKDVNGKKVTVSIEDKLFDFELNYNPYFKPGEKCEALIRPEAVKLKRTGDGRFVGVIKKVTFLCGLAEYVVALGESVELIVKDALASPAEIIPIGSSVGVDLLTENIQIFRE